MPTDVQELPDKFLLRADLPGVKQEQIQISADKGILSIEVNLCSPSEQSDCCAKTEEYHIRERPCFEKLERHLSFPDTVDFDNVSASLELGVLTLEIHKKSEEIKQRKEIKIQ